MRGLPMAHVITALLVILLPATVFPQIVINEIMQNPDFTPDVDGEWIELFNAGDAGVDINHWEIRDDGSNTHVIENNLPLIIPPGGYAVLGRTADRLLNGDVPVDYAYGSDITLGNGSDQVVLLDADGVEQDRVAYDDGETFPDPTGASMELINPRAHNGNGLSWKTAVVPWAGHDLGTPGSANSVLDTLPPVLAGVVTLSETEIDVRFNEPVDTESSQNVLNYMITPGIGSPLFADRDPDDPALVHIGTTPLESGISYVMTVSNIQDWAGNVMTPDSLLFSLTPLPNAGAVVITEIMMDPDAVSDASGEWFEVYNPGTDSVDMEGWSIGDDASNTFTVSGRFVVPPAQFAVFTVNDDSSSNGGMDPPLTYDWGSSSTFTLGNTDDKIIIRSGNSVIDSVSYSDTSPWPDATGGSIGLADFNADNNDGAHWTTAPLREPHYVGASGDLGSPGSAGKNQGTGNSGLLTVTPPDLTFFAGTGDSYSLSLSLSNSAEDSIAWSAEALLSEGSWLSVCPPEGIIPPMSSQTLMATADAESLLSGAYNAELTIRAVSESVSVPVMLTVLDTTIVPSLTLAPDSLPVPPGGREIPMEIIVENLTGVPRKTDLWALLTVPGITDPKVVVGPKHPSLEPFATVRKSRALSVPAHAPAGEYRLEVAIGLFPDSITFLKPYFFQKATDSSLVSRGETLTGRSGTVFLAHYPNPFNSTAVIQYGLKEDTWVILSVFNLLGQEVARLVDRFQTSGEYSVVWDGINKAGNACGTGVYLVQVRSAAFTKTRLMTLLR